MHGVEVNVVDSENEGLIFRSGCLVAAVALEGKVIPNKACWSALELNEYDVRGFVLRILLINISWKACTIRLKAERKE